MKPYINPKTRVMKVVRSLTAPMRVMPNFLFIGGNRCGTTTLYRHLCDHPCVAPSVRSEVLFFDLKFAKGLGWYKTHFPTVIYKHWTQLRTRRFLTGEGTTYYMFHPRAPQRIRETLPEVKLIILLRNPVDRAYSQYHQKIRRGRETLSFEDAVEAEPRRLEGELEKMLADANYISVHHRDHSYLARGVYISQLSHWMTLFPKEQMLILRSEDLRVRPADLFKQALRFLELPIWEPPAYDNYNFATYCQMESRTRKRLIDYFNPHNQRLYEFLGRDFGWDR
ncbi:MAG: sulfotransferase domain-containing protein [Candidatus Binatia bacterium]